jgi:sterol desaturase/sphingolipid hydroxylase (fatty acid hydroxylase superfamily)
MIALFQSEPVIRIACFAGVFAAMVVWELLAPRRKLATRKPWRWASNLGLVFLNSLLLRLIAPLGAVGVALATERLGWGLFNAVTVPPWVAIVASVVLLDFAIYLQHVMFHAVPLFWRLHMVHHADLDIDVTTGVRFHTVEILLSFGIKSATILLLGPPAVAVIIFEVLLNATSMFNHSNVRMPLWVDRVLRWLVVTPDMHRVHHSWYRQETNSNFGFNHPWWDRLMGTYRDQPTDGHTGMTIGLMELRDERQVDRLHRMLWLPLIQNLGDYPVNRAAHNREVKPAASNTSSSTTQQPDSESVANDRNSQEQHSLP